MVDECLGTYYQMQIEKMKDIGSLSYTKYDLVLITDRSCPDGECPECDRMRLMEQVNDYDYSFKSRMEGAPINNWVYKLEYEDADGDRHLTELVKVDLMF